MRQDKLGAGRDFWGRPGRMGRACAAQRLEGAQEGTHHGWTENRSRVSVPALMAATKTEPSIHYLQTEGILSFAIAFAG